MKKTKVEIKTVFLIRFSKGSRIFYNLRPAVCKYIKIDLKDYPI